MSDTEIRPVSPKMSTSTSPPAPALNCVICTGFSSPPSNSNSSHTSDDKLVVFFLQNFLKYPLLPEDNSNSGENVRAKDFLDDFVQRYGRPTENIWFCPSCLPTVQEGRGLYKKIQKVEAKLNALRRRVEAKVVDSFKSEGEEGLAENGHHNKVFQAVRRNVFEKGKSESKEEGAQDDSNLDNNIRVKEEYSSGVEDDGNDDVMMMGSPYFVPSSPEYPVIYPNVKLEEVEDVQKPPATDPPKRRRGRPRKNEVPSSGGGNDLRETIYERRSRRQVKYEEIDEKTDEEEAMEVKSVSEESWDGKDKEEDSEESDGVDSDYSPRSSKRLKTKLTNIYKKVRESSGAPRGRPGRKKKEDRVEKPRKNDGRGGHRIKSSVECRTCPVCKQVFNCHSKMNVHLNVKHLRNVLFNCSVCKKGFMRKDYLRTHMEIHLPEEDRLLKQALRELKGSDKAELTEKEQEDATASLESRTCTICSKTFDKMSILKIHIECVHNNSLAYSCHVCQKAFKWKDLLKKHMILHRDGEIKTKPVLPGAVTPAVPATRSFQCTFEGCTAAFRRQRDLDVHNRIHSGAKDFLCSKCGVSFRHEWSFRRHNILRHQAPEGKKYQCESCGKTFKIKWLLDQHLMSKSHGGAGLPKRTRRKAKDKDAPANPNVNKGLKANPENQNQVVANVGINLNANASTSSNANTDGPTSATNPSVIVPGSSNTNHSERSMEDSGVTAVDNYSGESQSPIDHSQAHHGHHDHRRYEAPHNMQQYYQQQNFRPDLLSLFPHSRDIINYSNNFGVSNAFSSFGYNVPSNDSQSQ